MINSADPDPQEKAQVEIEERLIGWLLKGAPGVMEVVASELRRDASRFHAPLDRVLQAILREHDAQGMISVATIGAALRYDLGLHNTGFEYLQTMAWACPAVASAEAGSKQALAAIRAWRKLQSPLPKPGDVEIKCADTITPTKFEWLWRDWIAASEVNLLAGSPGTGKTTIAIAVGATVTNGGNFPCGSSARTGSVLIWSGEDKMANSILPRFLACGGDQSRLHYVNGITGDNGATIPFDPAYDMERLLEAACKIDDLRLFIIDPVVSAVSGDSHKNAETRRSLQPLIDFAAQCGAAVLGITHYSKGTAGRDPLERVTGSHAFGALARVVICTARSKEPGEPSILVRAKSNNGPTGGGFQYSLERHPIGGFEGIEGQCVLWGEPLEGSAQSLLAEVESPEAEFEAPKGKAAEEWLLAVLGTGEVRATFIRETGEKAGHKWATVRRAKVRLGVEAAKKGLGGEWFWRMSKTLPPNQDAHL
jgi:putative DNA primase/helicase